MGILKRIEVLMTDFVEIEKRVEALVLRREMACREKENTPWQCPFDECKVEPYHLHIIPLATPVPGDTK